MSHAPAWSAMPPVKTATLRGSPLMRINPRLGTGCYDPPCVWRGRCPRLVGLRAIFATSSDFCHLHPTVRTRSGCGALPSVNGSKTAILWTSQSGHFRRPRRALIFNSSDAGTVPAVPALAVGAVEESVDTSGEMSGFAGCGAGRPRPAPPRRRPQVVAGRRAADPGGPFDSAAATNRGGPWGQDLLSFIHQPRRCSCRA